MAAAREPGGTLTLVVRDRGRWRPPPLDPGDRGRGLAIVRALMNVVDVDEATDGTTVTVRYRPAGLDAPPVAPGPGLVTFERGPEFTLARITGRSTSSTRRRRGRAGRAGRGPVVVDLSALAFLGSAGLQVLFALAERVQRLVVVAPADAPYRRALEVAELGRVAELVETVP